MKIGDMGVSKIVSNLNALQCTKVGTPLYLSPEIIKQIPYDYKVDLWSVGCSLYHLAALEPPFTGENVIVLGNNIVKSQHKQLPSRYSNEFRIMVDKLLSKKAELRPNSLDCITFIPKKVQEEYPNKIRAMKKNRLESTKRHSLMHDILETRNKEPRPEKPSPRENSKLNFKGDVVSNNPNDSIKAPSNAPKGNSVNAFNKNRQSNKQLKEAITSKMKEDSKIPVIPISIEINNEMKELKYSSNDVRDLKEPETSGVLLNRNTWRKNLSTDEGKVLEKPSSNKHRDDAKRSRVQDEAFEGQEANEIDKLKLPKGNLIERDFKARLNEMDLNRNSAKMRPNTAMDKNPIMNITKAKSKNKNDLVIPKLSQPLNRPMTAFQQKKECGNIINININVYNFDFKSKFFQPSTSGNILYFNDKFKDSITKSICKEKNRESLHLKPQKKKASRPRTSQYRHKADKGIQSFQEILNSIENIRFKEESNEKKLTITEFNRLKL